MTDAYISKLMGAIDELREKAVCHIKANIRLQAIVDAQGDLLSWYEDEHELSCQDEGSLPEEFLELTNLLKVAKEA